MRLLKAKELRALPSNELRRLATSENLSDNGLDPHQVTINKTWFQQLDDYNARFADWESWLVSMQENPRPINPETQRHRPRAFWGPGPCPSLPPHPPKIWADETRGRPKASESTVIVPVRIKLSTVNKIQAQAGDVSVAVFLRNLIESLISSEDGA